MEVQKYRVESHDNQEDLVKAVNRMLNNGWILQGGVSHSIETNKWMNERKGYEESQTNELFMQAMVLLIK